MTISVFGAFLQQVWSVCLIIYKLFFEPVFAVVPVDESISSVDRVPIFTNYHIPIFIVCVILKNIVVRIGTWSKAFVSCMQSIGPEYDCVNSYDCGVFMETVKPSAYPLVFVIV